MLKIINVECGTGLPIELAKRDYQVTGIDLLESLLQKAREKAKKEGVQMYFLDMIPVNYHFKKRFDVAIMLCEGGFPLMETDEMNYEILKNVSKALKDKAKFMFTTLNSLVPLFHSIN